MYALAFVWGQAVVHHRLAVFTAPALAVLVLPTLLSNGRRVPQLLAGSLGMGLLAFAFYLYMPLRARMGAWTYGDPGTWQGFWFIFWAREVPFLMVPPSTVAKLLDNIRIVLAQLVFEWTAPGLIAIGLGLLVAVGWRKTRQFGWALVAWVATFMVYLFILPEAVSPEKVLLWVSLVLALALAILVARLWQARAWAGAMGAVALVALAGVSGFTHRQDVLALTRDPHGREIITLLKAEMPVGQVATCPAIRADLYGVVGRRLLCGGVWQPCHRRTARLSRGGSSRRFQADRGQRLAPDHVAFHVRRAAQVVVASADRRRVSEFGGPGAGGDWGQAATHLSRCSPRHAGRVG